MESGAVISVKEIADLLLAARGRIDFYWNFYLAVVVAVIGWLMSRKLAPTRSMKLLVSVVYLIAATMNFLGLYSSYTLAEALRTDLLRIDATATLASTRQLLEQHAYLPQRLVALWVHLAIGAAVLLVVWFARFPEVEAGAARAGTGNGQGSR